MTYTKVPNGLIEAIPDMNGSEIAVCMVVCRQTLGYQRLWDKISITQFVKLTGMSNRSIIDAIEVAVADGWIIRKRDGDSYQYTIRGAEEILASEKTSHENVAETNLNATPLCEESSQGSEKTSRGGSVKTSHTKENISLAKANVPAEPQPLSAQIHGILERIEHAKGNERQPLLLEAYHLCFGKNGDEPTYSYLGKVAKDVGGAGRLVELMVSLVPRPPTGDKLAYIMAAHKAKSSRNGYGSQEVDLQFLLNRSES